MSFTMPMKYPARLEDGEIVDADGRKQFLDQKRVVEVINELHEWRKGLKSIQTEELSQPEGDAFARSLDNMVAVLLTNGKIDDGQARFLTRIARMLDKSVSPQAIKSKKP